MARARKEKEQPLDVATALDSLRELDRAIDLLGARKQVREKLHELVARAAVALGDFRPRVIFTR